MLELADARSEQDKLLEQRTTLTNDVVGRLDRLDDLTSKLSERLAALAETPTAVSALRTVFFLPAPVFKRWYHRGAA